MKSTATLLVSLIALQTIAQSPLVEGSYLPVRGTVVKEVWDMNYNQLPVPTQGINQSWDYGTSVFIPTDTFQIRTYHPDTADSRLSFPNWVSFQKLKNIYPQGTTHVSVLRSPSTLPLIDSLVSFYHINRDGLYLLGGYNFKKTINAKINAKPYPGEFVIPQEVSHNAVNPAILKDSVKIYGVSPAYYISQFGVYRPAKTVTTQVKTMTTLGYGTLKTPAGIFNNTILARETYNNIDSVFVDIANNGNYTPLTPQVYSYHRYSFFRNNTFGSSVLLLLVDNAVDNKIDYGWYTLPVDVGSISGTVRDSSGALLTQGVNKVYLYRENSNFSKNDILVKTKLDNNGQYHFDSIPYGLYRVAVRPDTIFYPNSMTTYYGDSVVGSPASWLKAGTINTLTCRCNATGKNIKIKYYAPKKGGGQIRGSLSQNFNIARLMAPAPDLEVFSAKDIDGIDVIIKKKPGGTPSAANFTDANGNFSVTGLSDGEYEIYVDIPGLYMSNTYEFTINGNTLIEDLDYVVGRDSIHPAGDVTTRIKIIPQEDGTVFYAYPNPFKDLVTIHVSLPVKSNVLLEVVNVLGERVSLLANEEKASGGYQYHFNAGTHQCPAGIYFVRCTINGVQHHYKIMHQ